MRSRKRSQPPFLHSSQTFVQTQQETGRASSWLSTPILSPSSFACTLVVAWIAARISHAVLIAVDAAARVERASHEKTEIFCILQDCNTSSAEFIGALQNSLFLLRDLDLCYFDEHPVTSRAPPETIPMPCRSPSISHGVSVYSQEAQTAPP